MWSLSVVVLQIDQLIACLQSSVNQQGLIADKKREGRCWSDFFFFTVCKTFFWLYRSVGFEGNVMYAKKVLRQPHNVLTLQVSLSLRDK